MQHYGSKMGRILGIGLLLILVFMGTSRADGQEVRAVKVQQPPAIDGEVEAVWAQAPSLSIPVAGPSGSFTVTMKALYTESDLYLLFQWPDATESLNRLYTYDGKAWKKVKGNEDRFNVMWGNNIANFKKMGCFALCHGNAMHTNAPEERGDLWHWKAQRTNPAGYADDQYIVHEPKEHEPGEVTGRLTDAKSGGGYQGNWDKAGKHPQYTFKSPPPDRRVLLKEQAVPLTDLSTVKAGDILPREVLARAEGSRGDITAKGRWANGTWTLELQRALVTGHEDDIQFADLHRDYYFSISVHDNSGEAHHSFATRAYKLEFE
ncbi:MAG: hypothetical protein D6736_10250 [Nitrospinota bacterium]|nr:MAG: hypothetical protein D6736_10250 [Nitrospinota bacterium]